MRLALISDIHGNLEAFREVLADIAQVGVDKIISLGDNIGYGPDPEAVNNLVMDLNIPSVMGNHELAIVVPYYLDWPNARCSSPPDA
ncbi:MAG: metallophosphoesterase [Deltaproteobacteria bacterium]|nr:metallophosphoesterase [Deltaproteobacteria bacterium]